MKLYKLLRLLMQHISIQFKHSDDVDDAFLWLHDWCVSTQDILGLFEFLLLFDTSRFT